MGLQWEKEIYFYFFFFSFLLGGERPREGGGTMSWGKGATTLEERAELFGGLQHKMDGGNRKGWWGVTSCFVGVGGATVRGEGGKGEAETSSKKWLTPRERHKPSHPYSDKFVFRHENHFC